MHFRDLPIKRKLAGGFFLTGLSVLTITCLVVLSYEIYSYKRAATRSLSTIADSISANSAVGLVFDDLKLTGEILAGLRAEPDVIAAALFDNGIELVSELRAGNADFHGVAPTGCGREEDFASGQNAGFASHLTKPIGVQSLEAALTAIMKL